MNKTLRERMRLTRRQLLAGAAATTAGAAVPGVLLARDVPRWQRSCDVLVAGTGAAGSSAALFARQAGADVLMIDKAAYYGGTTAKSQGGYWIPNNSLMRKRGLKDPRESALRYMARLSYPTKYAADAPRLGLAEAEYDLIATYYDQAAPTLDALHAMGALQSTFFVGSDGTDMPDYYAHLPENEAPIGRILQPRDAAGKPAMGDELIRQLKARVDSAAIPVLLGHRAWQLVMDESGAVLGLVVRGADDAEIAIRASRGVVFATGGFIHNPRMRQNFLRGPVYGGCTAAAAEGDFVTIGEAAGASLGNMNNAWWAQIVFEQAIENSAVPMNVFIPPGDSMIEVNRYGKRFVDEKFVYNERSQAHFVWDPRRAEYPNLLAFMIYDSHTARHNAGFFPIPPGGEAPYVLQSQTLEGLAKALERRLAKLASHTGGLALDPAFVANLKATVARFNGFANTGKDEDFLRGEVPSALFFNRFYMPPGTEYPYPNQTMRPLSDQGPYYAIILCAGVLDTKGGPVIDTRGQVQDAFGKVIPGLYGAGNCIAAPAASAYWSAGATIGAALTFGRLAGEAAARA